MFTKHAYSIPGWSQSAEDGAHGDEHDRHVLAESVLPAQHYHAHYHVSDEAALREKAAGVVIVIN